MMNKKIRVAFIYEKNNIFLSGKHFDNNLFHFCMNALKRNESIDVDYFPADIFEINILKDKFDIILLVGFPKELIGIEKLDIPIVQRIGDPHSANKKEFSRYSEKIKVDCYFSFFHPDQMYKYLPRKFRYKTIFEGIESSLYEHVKPFNERIKNKILNSGASSYPKLIDRLRVRIIDPRNDMYKWYKLRTDCNSLSFVDYTRTLDHEFVGDKYPILLQKYATAIASSTYYIAWKYWEIPAAGCLTFMEVSNKNKIESLGYNDGETAIFINEQNYKEKFNEYLSDIENPKWEKIANEGRKFTLQKFNNDKGVESLVELMKELL